MQTTKLQLILAEPEVPVPDTAYTGGFMGSASASGNIIAMIITVTILSIITGVIIYKLYKAKKLNLLIPVFLILGLTTATFSPLFINANKHNAFAADSYATLETPEQVDMNGEIKESTFTSSKVTITKPDATNYGYELYILANEANDDLNFIPKTETNETVITSIEQVGALTANTYGFTLEQDAKAEDEVWYPLSDVADLLASYDTATTANNTTDVYFGVLTDNTVLPDTYTLDIDFYATNTLATIDNLTYMQEFKSISQADLTNVKDSMVLEQQYQLKDSRDNKTYYIAKLKDGKVWMTQNLDHDIVTTDDFYNSINTDLNRCGSRGYDISNGYVCFDDDGYISWAPNAIATSPDRWGGSSTSYPNRPLFWQGDEGACPNSATAGCNDGHSYANNYYDWRAATAGGSRSDYASLDYVAENSICPAGWRLPYNSYVDDAWSELEQLLDVYHVSDGYSSQIMSEPLWFVASGYVANAGLGSYGVSGLYWTSTAVGGGNDYLLFNTSNGRLDAFKNNAGRTGLSVRCLAR